MNLWSLENGYNNYLATSPTGTATGFGASVLIIDDLIKSADEANNANILEKHWWWFTNTMLSRLEENGKIIIVMTRWHSQDLAGRVLQNFSNFRLKHISYKAEQLDGSMLCSEILSKRSYENKKKKWVWIYAQQTISKSRLTSRADCTPASKPMIACLLMPTVSPCSRLSKLHRYSRYRQ